MSDQEEYVLERRKDAYDEDHFGEHYVHLSDTQIEVVAVDCLADHIDALMSRQRWTIFLPI